MRKTAILFIAVAALVAAGIYSMRPALAVPCAVSAPSAVGYDGTCSTDLNLATYDLVSTPATGAQCIYDELGATCGTRTDDSNANSRMINTSNVYPFAAGARVPGKMFAQGGLDSKTVTCAVATCTGTDTVIVTRVISGVTTGPTTLTWGTDFCAGGICTTDALMATSLAGAIDALSGVGATAQAAVVGVTADRLTSGILITDSDAHAACTVISLGTDGGTVVANRLIIPTPSGQADATHGACIVGSAGENTSPSVYAGDCSSAVSQFSAAVMTATFCSSAFGGCSISGHPDFTSIGSNAGAVNIEMSSAANAYHEYGMLAGSNADTTGQVSFAVCNDCDNNTTDQQDVIACFEGIGTLTNCEGPGVVAGSGDAAPTPAAIHYAQNASHLATTPSSKIGANSCFCAGLGQRLITIVSTVATTGKAVTFNATLGTCAAATPLVITEGGGSWVCPNGTGVAACALSLKNAINAAAASSVGIELASCTTAGGGTCSDGIVAVRPLPSTCALNATDNAAAEITETESADGADRIYRPTWVDGAATADIRYSSLVDSYWTVPQMVTAGNISAQGSLYISTAAEGCHCSNYVEGWPGGIAKTRITLSTEGIATVSKSTSTGAISFDVTGTVKGQTTSLTSVATNCTFPANPGAATCVTAASIPHGAAIKGYSARVVTPSTNCTTCTIGPDLGGGVTDADNWGTAIECDVDTTTVTTADATADWMGGCWKAGGCTVTMTAVGGNCFDGVTAFTIHYETFTAATAD